MREKHITENSLDGPSSTVVDEGSSGAVLVFRGVVRRDETHRGAVERIEYETYREMAEMEMGRIKRDAMERFELTDIVLVHRVGTVAAGETSLYIAIGSPHRKSGLRAMDYVIDEIKAKVPIWKKEVFDDGSHEWR